MKGTVAKGSGLLLILGILGCTLFSNIFFVKSAHAALATAPYSTAGLNAKLYGGVQQAIDWDLTCYNAMVANRNAGESPRTAINTSPSYHSLQWMSLADTSTQNNSSRTAPIVVDYGTMTVPLQLNMVRFLCAALVSPDGAGDTFAYTDQRVVRNLNNANDRAPNPMGGNTNWPAQTDQRFRIDNIQVTQGNGHVTGVSPNTYIGTPRQANTRYWFANAIPFTFVSNSPNGITSNQQIQIKFTLRGYNTYYYNTYQCYANNLYMTGSNFNINRCNENDVVLSVQVQLRSFYDLTPTTSVNGQTSAQAGGTATVTNVVNKAPGGTNSDNTDWRLTQMVYSPGTTLSPADIAARDSGTDPCSSFTTNGRVSCATDQENGSAVFSNPTTTFNPTYTYNVPDNFVAGTKVCFVGSVNRPTQAPTPVWRHSAMTCIIISQKPKMQVWGGDVKTQGLVETGVVTDSNGGTAKQFGSWVEYAVFSVGTNTGFASGSGLNNGSTDTQPNINKFTFANVDNNGASSYGLYALSPSASISDQFMNGVSSGPPTSGNLGNLSSGTYTTNNFTIGTSTVGFDPVTNKGKSIIIIASGTVTINGNITYAAPGGSFTDVSQLPQVVIIANTINIADSATTVNAWLLTRGANGTINTCSDRLPTDPLNSTVCKDQLTINGPIATSHLYLRRTYGVAPNDPAEIVNLRPDAYIWAYLRASQAGKATTRYTIELPPRF